jgi:hypothetical protein
MNELSNPLPAGETVSPSLQAGAQLFQSFNQFPPDRYKLVRHTRLMPPIVVELGELAGLIYRSDKWHPGKPHTYIHFMDNPPRLVSNVNGNQLYIVGGSYRITERGIEG